MQYAASLVRVPIPLTDLSCPATSASFASVAAACCCCVLRVCSSSWARAASSCSASALCWSRSCEPSKVVGVTLDKTRTSCKSCKV